MEKQKPEINELRSKNAKAFWADPEKAAALSAKRKALWQDPEYRAKASKNRRGIPVSAEQRKKLSKAGKGKPKPAAWREKMSAITKEWWSHLTEEERRERMSKATYGASILQKPTSLEIAVKNALDALGVAYRMQHRYGPYYFDFYIEHLKLDIECDGLYWHSSPKGVKKDRTRDGWLALRHVRICRLTEAEIVADARQAVLRALELKESDT